MRFGQFHPDDDFAICLCPKGHRQSAQGWTAKGWTTLG